MSWITQYIYCITVADLGSALGTIVTFQKNIFSISPSRKDPKMRRYYFKTRFLTMIALIDAVFDGL